MGRPAAADDTVCQVAFSDGSMALGSLVVRSDGEAILESGAYKTAAGTNIPAKRWRIEFAEDDAGVTNFKVRDKLSG